MFFKLAFLNIFRNFKRTVFTFLAIAVGIMVIIILDSMLQGMDRESFAKIINYETGHIKIFSKGYMAEKDDLPLGKAIIGPEFFMAKIKKDPEIEGITSRINFKIMLSDGIDQLPAVAVAIKPQTDNTVFQLKSALLKGEFLGPTDDAILVGEGLAEDFNVKVGDYLTVLTRTKYETFQALDFRIKGILRTEDPQIDWFSIVLPMNIAQNALDLNNAVTEIDIKLKDINNTKEFRDKIAKDIIGIEVATYEDLAEDVMAISRTKYTATLMIFFSVIIIALIGISNTILMAAFERTREIGMMAAMGMKRRQIIWLFVMEGAWIGALGSLVGVILGSALVLLWVVPVGMDFSFMIKEMGRIGYRSTGVFKGVWNPSMVIIAFIFGIVVSAITSIYPAIIASRMEPTEALRKGK